MSDVARELRVHGVDGLARHGAGTDPRGSPEDEDATTADVKQCRTLNTIQTKKGPVSFWSGDLCPHDGGIDQNIYGDLAP
jgi:hypothetical protein